MAAPEPKFITLTLLHHTGQTLADQLYRLHEAFRKFRRHHEIRKNLHGGIWFLQVKRGSDNEWHSHLHIAADCTFIAHRTLSDIWLKASSDSKIIDIQTVRDRGKLAAYVARYVSKPIRLSELSFADAVEVVSTCKGRRLFGKFGTAKDLDFAIDKSADASNLIYIGSFKTLLRLATIAGDTPSFNVVAAWHTGLTLTRQTIEAARDLAALAIYDNDP